MIHLSWFTCCPKRIEIFEHFQCLLFFELELLWSAVSVSVTPRLRFQAVCTAACSSAESCCHQVQHQDAATCTACFLDRVVPLVPLKLSASPVWKLTLLLCLDSNFMVPGSLACTNSLASCGFPKVTTIPGGHSTSVAVPRVTGEACGPSSLSCQGQEN